MEYAKSQNDLLEYIRTKSGEVESSTAQGTLYQEIPFSGYDCVAAHRENSAKRIQILSEHIDFSDKTVLDIGCNVGYFCFELAKKGAKCWGIDDNADAIYIAKSLQHIHAVDNVNFIHGEVSETTISSVIDQAGHFDVILLNSVVHWLIYGMGSIRRVICLLNLLNSPSQQHIVYEPSSSDSAYYPEELKAENISTFFTQLGVKNYQKIGENFASNVNEKREIWMGTRDLYSDVRAIDDFLGDSCEHSNVKLARSYRKGIVSLVWHKWLIKTVETRYSPHNCLLRNEAQIVTQLMKAPEYVPILINNVGLNGRIYLIYENIEGKSFANIFVHKQDLWWISRELLRFLDILRSMDLVHNDLQPQNIILLKNCRQIRAINFELGGIDKTHKTVENKCQSALINLSLEETHLLTSEIDKTGGGYRSSRGPGYHENDRYAINKIIAQITNRRSFVNRWLYLTFAKQILDFKPNCLAGLLKQVRASRKR